MDDEGRHARFSAAAVQRLLRRAADAPATAACGVLKLLARNMMRLELKPHLGIGPIRFGANKEEIRLAMSQIGMPLDLEKKSQDSFGNYRVQVEYEDDNTASFIGANSHPELALDFEGFDLFDMEARDAFTLLEGRDGTGDHAFSSFEYILPGQIVTFYEADPQYDRR